MSKALKSPNSFLPSRRSAVGALLLAVVLSNAGCSAVSNLTQGDKSEARSQSDSNKKARECEAKNDPDKIKGSVAIRAAGHNNRITTCVLIPSKVNLSAIHQLRLEAISARNNTVGGKPKATAIIGRHYKTDFGISEAGSPEEVRDALEDGKSFRDVTEHILDEDLPYVPGGLIAVGLDDKGDVDISISLGSNSLPDGKDTGGRAGLLNSDGLTDSLELIKDDRLKYVLAPVGKSRPRG